MCALPNGYRCPSLILFLFSISMCTSIRSSVRRTEVVVVVVIWCHLVGRVILCAERRTVPVAIILSLIAADAPCPVKCVPVHCGWTMEHFSISIIFLLFDSFRFVLWKRRRWFHLTIDDCATRRTVIMGIILLLLQTIVGWHEKISLFVCFFFSTATTQSKARI